MDNLILDKIIVERNIVRYQFSVSGELAKYFTTKEMFVRYDRDISSVPESILAIPFVGSVIALTWLTNSILWVKEIDDTYYNAMKQLKVAYQELYPYYPLGGRFVAAYRKQNEISAPRENSAVLLFSGGIDAHTSYVRNKQKTLTLCNIQGWLPTPSSTSEAQEADFKDIRDFAQNENVHYALLTSNFAILINSEYFDKKLNKKIRGNWWYKYQHSMSFISIAIPLAYINNTKEILIASSYFIGSSGICASYPTTDNEFRFATNGLTFHDGFELTRQDKISTILTYQQTTNKKYPIRVCSFNDHNCCVCPKCFRTILGIIAEGGCIKDFGFHIKGDILSFYKKYIPHHYIQFGIESEAVLYWPEIKERIKQNYDNIQEKEFVDWFCSTNFVKERKRAVLKYRITKFIPLVIKKLKRQY